MPRPPRQCHYCGARGRTKDHIVPRVRVRELERRCDVRRLSLINLVPACDACNQAKGAGESPCGCAKCARAWDLYWLLWAIARDTTKPRRSGASKGRGATTAGVLGRDSQERAGSSALVA